MELRVQAQAVTRTAILERLAYDIRNWGKLAMASKCSKLVSLLAALLLVLVAAPACAKSSDEKSNAQQKPDAKAASSSTAATATEATDTETTAAGKPETVVFEVTGTGSALTIDLVPSGPDRLQNVPLPWTSTITITPDVIQLQVVVVSTGETSPGCKITLEGQVVAEKPVGGDAHCIFDR